MSQSNLKINSTAHISPTAHYTGYVWYKNGLSPKGWNTGRGFGYYWAFRPLDGAASVLFKGTSLENYLLRRHLAIDYLVSREIATGQVSTVIEIASGLSPRGVRLAKQHPTIQYYETDLPAMIKIKEQRLASLADRPTNLHCRTVDALLPTGSGSLQEMAEEIDGGLVVITEGLLGYFNREQAGQTWRNIAAMSRGASLTYFSDMYVDDELDSALFDTFRRGLGMFVGNKIELPFTNEQDVQSTLLEAKFSEAKFIKPDDLAVNLERPTKGEFPFLNILEARVS